MIETIKRDNKKEIILGVDHNLNLLKATSHKGTQDLIDINFNNNLLPCITQPTCITKSTATLIDNLFISHALHTALTHVY